MPPDRYYTTQLSGERLRQCYDIAPPRVKQYLEAEIEHVLSQIDSSHLVLELGCGYGRVLERLAQKARKVVGIDTSWASLRLARERLAQLSHCFLLQMDAACLGFADRSFDRVVCIQNGISAFKVDPKELLRESLRITRVGGRVLFSSYSEKFWKDRLEWFVRQAEAGLIGEIDWGLTRDGVIVCRDGFRATTYGPADFLALLPGPQREITLQEVDESSLFFEVLI
ncbi:MAG: methyltransferase domain-containing protein [Desulfobacterota bacterium]|nr:methyltransferase domain-containing protein [Thermodesulfobacteriota bacterium]